MNQLIPRQPKRKRQPTAECMREQLRLAADEIIRLRIRLSFYADPHSDYRVVTLRNGPWLADKTPRSPVGMTTQQQIAHVSGLVRTAREAMNNEERKRAPWWRRIFKRAA